MEWKRSAGGLQQSVDKTHRDQSPEDSSASPFKVQKISKLFRAKRLSQLQIILDNHCLLEIV